jgi:hypothetical protein
MNLWNRFGLRVIRVVDFVLWKLFPKASYDYLVEQCGQLDDFIYVDNVFEYIGDMHEYEG